MTSVPSWLWLAAGWCALALGGWLTLFARLRLRRLKGRLCGGTECRYNMQGLSSLTCPECGRTAKSEQELTTRPLKKRWRIAGLLLLTLGWISLQAPTIIARGWTRAVPNWGVAVLAPVHDPATAFLNEPGEYRQPLPIVGKTYERLEKDLYAEAHRRLWADELPDSAARWYLRRTYSQQLLSLTTDLRTPAFWPAGEALPLPAYRPQGVSSPRYLDTAIGWADESRGLLLARVVYNTRTSYTLGSIQRPIDCSFPAATLLQQVTSPEIDQAIAAAAHPTLIVDGERAIRLEFHDWSSPIPCYAAFTLTLHAGDRTLDWKCGISPSDGSEAATIRRWDLSSKWTELAKEHLNEIEVELVSEPDRAIDIYTKCWSLDNASTTRPRAWSGTIRVKPTIERRWVNPSDHK